MTNHQTRLVHNPTHWYLELARGAFQGIHYPKPLEEILDEPEFGSLQEAVMALMTMTIIYSYLSVESFVNYQLYQVWADRNRGAPSSKRLMAICGKIATFDEFKKNRKLGDVGDKINILASVLDVGKPCDVDPALWCDFRNLAEVARHFLVHPYPDKEYFQANMRRIGMEVEGGLYLRTACALMGHFYDATKVSRPGYLAKNTLLRFRGVDLLPGRGS